AAVRMAEKRGRDAYSQVRPQPLRLDKGNARHGEQVERPDDSANKKECMADALEAGCNHCWSLLSWISHCQRRVVAGIQVSSKAHPLVGVQLVLAGLMDVGPKPHFAEVADCALVIGVAEIQRGQFVSRYSAQHG